jgi:hypothetical protein
MRLICVLEIACWNLCGICVPDFAGAQVQVLESVCKCCKACASAGMGVQVLERMRKCWKACASAAKHVEVLEQYRMFDPSMLKGFAFNIKAFQLFNVEGFCLQYKSASILQC